MQVITQFNYCGATIIYSEFLDCEYKNFADPF